MHASSIQLTNFHYSFSDGFISLFCFGFLQVNFSAFQVWDRIRSKHSLSIKRWGAEEKVPEVLKEREAEASNQVSLFRRVTYIAAKRLLPARTRRRADFGSDSSSSLLIARTSSDRKAQKLGKKWLRFDIYHFFRYGGRRLAEGRRLHSSDLRFDRELEISGSKFQSENFVGLLLLYSNRVTVPVESMKVGGGEETRLGRKWNESGIQRLHLFRVLCKVEISPRGAFRSEWGPQFSFSSTLGLPLFFLRQESFCVCYCKRIYSLNYSPIIILYNKSMIWVTWWLPWAIKIWSSAW